MRILITGASGFLGQAAARRLTADGHHVIAAAETPESVRGKLGIEHARDAVGFDLGEPGASAQVVEAYDPEAVLHLGAKSEVAHSFDNYAEVSRVNYVGTVGLIEAFHRKASNPRLFLMASTMETYGRAISVTAGDFTPQRPMAPYAVAKVACEHYVRYVREAYGLPTLTLRQTNTYGRHDNDFFVMERIITQMLRGDEVKLGDPEPARNFLFVDDLIELYSRAMAQPSRAATIEHPVALGPDNALTIRELVRTVGTVLGWRGDITWKTLEPRPGEIARLDSVTSPRLVQALDWEPEVGLEDGIRLTARMWGWDGEAVNQ